MLTPEDTSAPQPAPDEAAADARDGLFAISISVALLALLGAVLAVGFGWRALDESSGDGTASAAESGGGTAPVELSEFAITPASVGAGGSLEVTNAGAAAHNVTIEGADLATADLGSGEAEELPLGDLAAGTYTMFCSIPGHREAGMEAPLTVTEGAAATPTTGAGDHAGHEMDYEQMTEDMLASVAAYPAETEGVGNPLLEPTEVTADGTKVFDLTMELGDWEVEPGKVVEAWTFNGVVPAPTIKLALGDKMALRVKNDLPLATDVHLHGLNVENEYDGVGPITQDLIEPGETFTYEYTADEQAVAMYHPHAHGHMLLPNGMFGVILVDQVRLPLGQTVGLEQVPSDLKVAQELPMVLNDSGVIGYSLNGKSFPATAPISAKTGDWVLIHYFNEGTQIHPMHLHQFDQIVVAKDGYPVDFPYTADTVNVAPGERYSVLVQLDKPGVWVWHCHILPHVERESGMFGMVTAVIVE